MKEKRLRKLLIVILIFHTMMAMPQTLSLGRSEISGRHLSHALEGKWVYVTNSEHVKLDSVRIVNHSFQMSAEIDTLHTYLLVLGETQVPFTREPGNVVVEVVSEKDGYKVVEGSLSMLYGEMAKVVQAGLHRFYAKTENIQKDSSIVESLRNDLLAEVEKESESWLRSTINGFYNANINNAVAAYVFNSIPFATDANFIEAYEAAPAHVKRNLATKHRYETLISARSTDVGGHFRDFLFKDSDGQQRRMSDFRKTGRFFLLDFWASWCVPCKHAMPHLAKLYNKLGQKGLDVVSIAVFDKVLPYQKAKAVLNMTWPSVMDLESVGAKVYGVQAVPTLILFDPEGKILVRTHLPEKVDATLKGYFTE